MSFLTAEKKDYVARIWQCPFKNVFSVDAIPYLFAEFEHFHGKRGGGCNISTSSAQWISNERKTIVHFRDNG